MRVQVDQEFSEMLPHLSLYATSQVLEMVSSLTQYLVEQTQFNSIDNQNFPST